ncbi:MAG: hypothetical protein ABIO44_11900, partial [Saprospiraceae bacterium]
VRTSKDVSCIIQDNFNFKSTSNLTKKNSVYECVLESSTRGIKFLYDTHDAQRHYQFISTFGNLITIDRSLDSSKVKLNLQYLLKEAIGNANLKYVVGISESFVQCRSEDVLYKVDKAGNVSERIKIERF